MKTIHFLIICMVVALVGAVSTLWGSVLSSNHPSETSAPQDLPPIVLEKCIKVQNAVSPNPFSTLPNDFLMLAKYEEKSDETGAMKDGLKPEKALNIYLLFGILVSPENQGKGIVHNSLLIVKVSTTNADSSRETVREWIFVDDDGDQNVDRGVYRETVIGKEKKPISTKKVNFPENRRQELQAYYKKAAKALANRTAEGLGENCVIS